MKTLILSLTLALLAAGPAAAYNGPVRHELVTQLAQTITGILAPRDTGVCVSGFLGLRAAVNDGAAMLFCGRVGNLQWYLLQADLERTDFALHSAFDTVTTTRVSVVYKPFVDYETIRSGRWDSVWLSRAALSQEEVRLALEAANSGLSVR